MPTTWQAVGPRKPTSWSGRPSKPSPSSGSGKSSPCSGAPDGGCSTELLPPEPDSGHRGVCRTTSCEKSDDMSLRLPGQRGTPPPLRLGAPEVLGSDRVEELAELLDLVLLLVRDDQPGLGEHALLGVDGHPDPQRERHRVAGARRHRDAAVEHQLRVEGAFLQVGDPHLFEAAPEG